MTHAAGLNAEVLSQATIHQHAALYGLCVVGEALHCVSPNTRSLALHLPWNKAYAMRNRIIHSYWKIDITIVAGVIERDLPPLVDDLRTLIARMEEGVVAP